jgi:hypothetical protein
MVRLIPGVFSSKHYMQSASRTAHFSRTTRRRSAFPADTAFPLGSKISRASSCGEEHGADDQQKEPGIRVRTEVHISFDDETDAKDEELGTKREDSCESLIIPNTTNTV